MFFKKKLPSVTETTATFRTSVEKLDEEYKKNKESLVEAFHLKLKSLLSFKQDNIVALKEKVEKLYKELVEEHNDIELINKELNKY